MTEVDILLAEDTRKTTQLLNNYGIKPKKITAYNQENKHKKIPEVIQKLNQGESVGLVSNAGTPLISDPGYELVKLAVNQGVKLISIPGPSAVITALVVSGFPPTRFTFLGFLPKSGNKKSEIFKKLNQNKDLLPTVVFYESPKRILDTLKTMAETLGDIEIVICRELTKKFEEKIRGKLGEAIAELESRPEIKGEITVVCKLN